jgi:hypothetical protein
MTDPSKIANCTTPYLRFQTSGWSYSSDNTHWHSLSSIGELVDNFDEGDQPPGSINITLLNDTAAPYAVTITGPGISSPTQETLPAASGSGQPGTLVFTCTLPSTSPGCWDFSAEGWQDIHIDPTFKVKWSRPSTPDSAP